MMLDKERDLFEALVKETGLSSTAHEKFVDYWIAKRANEVNEADMSISEVREKMEPRFKLRIVEMLNKDPEDPVAKILILAMDGGG